MHMKYLLFGVHDFFFCFPYLFRKQTDQLTRSKSKCKPKRARIHPWLLSVNPLCIYIVNYCFCCVFSSLFNVPTCFFSWPWQMPHVIWTVWSAPTPMELIGLAILHFIVGWVFSWERWRIKVQEHDGDIENCPAAFTQGPGSVSN